MSDLSIWGVKIHARKEVKNNIIQQIGTLYDESYDGTIKQVVLSLCPWLTPLRKAIDETRKNGGKFTKMSISDDGTVLTDRGRCDDLDLEGWGDFATSLHLGRR
jgi:hypothetical protein